MNFKKIVGALALCMCFSNAFSSDCDLALVDTKVTPLHDRVVTQKIIAVPDGMVAVSLLDINWRVFANDPEALNSLTKDWELVRVTSEGARLYKTGDLNVIFMENFYDGTVFNIIGREPDVDSFVKEIRRCGVQSIWILK